MQAGVIGRPISSGHCFRVTVETLASVTVVS
jgi:hypothetical protein